MSSKELHSRLVFVDTSSYEDKNYQFGQFALKRLKEFVESGHLYLLITDITISEIKAHLQKKATDAASKIKKIQKDAMILRNTPELSCHGIFQKVTGEEILKIINSKFEIFLTGENIEVVGVDTISPSSVFEKYFTKKAPFDRDDKKSEFPDAFALEAVNKISQTRRHDLYVISKDGDMDSYCGNYENLIHLENIDKLIDLVVRNADELKEPAIFADSIFGVLEKDIVEKITDIISNSEFFSDDLSEYEDEITQIDVESIEIVNKNILEVSKEHAEYEVEFNVVLFAYYSVSDYDNSPWDPEDKAYLFVVTHEFVKKHRESYSAYVTITYTDGLKKNAEIEEINIDENSFSLSGTNSELINYHE